MSIGSGLRARRPLMELWLVDLERSGPALEMLERTTPRLTPADRTRLRRIADANERRYRRAAYIALRIALERLGGPAVGRQALVRRPGTRPRLAGGGPVFSLAHSSGMALIVVACTRTAPLALGVDLEADRRIAMSVRRRAEIMAAANGLAGTPAADPLDDDAFLRAWSRLEAFAKAHGHGLGRTLADLGLRSPGARDLSLADIAERARRLAVLRAIAVCDLALPPGFHGALALPRTWPPPLVRALPHAPRALARLALEAMR